MNRLPLAAFLAACHHAAGTVADAGPDAIGTETGDAPPGAVVITVAVAGTPLPGVATYFQNADSALVAAVLTDVNGTAFAKVASGGFVTIVAPPSGTAARALSTFAGVQPGDQLTIDLAPADARQAVDVGVTVPTFAGAAAYQLRTTCGEVDLGASGMTSDAQLIGCAGTADVVVVATDDNAVPLASVYAPAIAIADHKSLVFAGTYQPVATTTLTYSQVPTTVTFLGIDRILATPRGRMLDSPTNAMPSSGNATASVAMPSATGAIAVTVTDAFPQSDEFSEQLVYDWGADASSYTVALGAVMLPSYASAASFDPSTHALSWQEHAGGGMPDLARTRVRVTRDLPPAPVAWTWQVIAPRQAAPSVQFPTLPADGFDFNVGSSDTVAVEELTNAQLPGGYDAFRAHGFADLATAIAGASGRLVVELPYSVAL